MAAHSLRYTTEVSPYLGKFSEIIYDPDLGKYSEIIYDVNEEMIPLGYHWGSRTFLLFCLCSCHQSQISQKQQNVYITAMYDLVEFHINASKLADICRHSPFPHNGTRTVRPSWPLFHGHAMVRKKIPFHFNCNCRRIGTGQVAKHRQLYLFTTTLCSSKEEPVSGDWETPPKKT